MQNRDKNVTRRANAQRATTLVHLLFFLGGVLFLFFSPNEEAYTRGGEEKTPARIPKE